MHVVILTIDVRIPAARSRKAKRAVLQSIVRTLDGWKAVGAAEVGYQDLWQRAKIGVVATSGSVGQVEEIAASVERYVWSRPEVEVVSIEVEPGAGSR